VCQLRPERPVDTTRLATSGLALTAFAVFTMVLFGVEASYFLKETSPLFFVTGWQGAHHLRHPGDHTQLGLPSVHPPRPTVLRAVPDHLHGGDDGAPCPQRPRGASVVYMVPPLDASLEDKLGYLSPDTRVVRTEPPDGEHKPGSTVPFFISGDPAARVDDALMRHLHRRPFIQIIPE
jgi:hypothetical protein